MTAALLVLIAFAVAAVAASWMYFRRFEMTRPPIGVINLVDVVVTMVFVILIPLLYILLPTWFAVGFLSISTLSLLYFTWEPVLPARWAIWLASLVMIVADVAAAWRYGTENSAFFVVNNLVLVVVVVGGANLWAQSGMRARDAAIMGAALTLFDFVATALLPVMDDMFDQLVGLPFMPIFAWSIDDGGGWMGMGLGDVLLAAVFPLVMHKAYGREAALTAMALALVAIAAILTSGTMGLLVSTFPVMVVLGPLMVIQYLFWHWRRGGERTTWQYLQAERR
ncbi:MAG: hypothetical protein ACK2UL_02610 [Anaerolineae bacterium]